MFERIFSDAAADFWRFSLDIAVFSGTSTQVSKFPAIVAECGERVGVLSDAAVFDLPLTREYCTALGAQMVASAFIGFESDLADIEAAIVQFRDRRIDTVVAIGGGSVLDGAKIVAACLGSGLAPLELPTAAVLPRPAVPLIALPTTFGTGSEVNRYGHINDRQNGKKYSLKKSYLTPKAAIVDPRFALALHPRQRFLCGMDAFVHVLEVLTLKRETSPLQQALMSFGLQLFVQHFSDYVEQPTLASAEAMAQVSLLGGLGIHNARTGLIHSLAVPFAHRSGLAHAASILPFIKPVLDWHWEAVSAKLPFTDRQACLAWLDSLVSASGDAWPSWNLQDAAAIEAMVEDCCRDAVLFKENPVALDEAALSQLYGTALSVMH